jgi:hypothetical protein
MKPLDRQAEVVFRKLTEGLEKAGDCQKVDGSVVAEFVEQTKLGPIISIKQFFELPNGRIVRDTDVAFLISSIEAITGNLVKDADKRIYPVSRWRNGLKEEAIVIHNGQWNVRLELQNEICQFAERWMLDMSDR